MTDQPFAVNLTVLPTINPPPYEEYAQAIVGSGVKIVETAGRSPEPSMELFKEYDVKVIHKCTSVRHALKAQSVGCDAITIDGYIDEIFWEEVLPITDFIQAEPLYNSDPSSLTEVKILYSNDVKKTLYLI